MMSRAVARAIALLCASLGVVFGLRGGASGEPVVLGQVDARFEADTCVAPLLDFTAVTGVRPMLRYPSYDVTIGHTSFAMVGQGGSVDIDASNSPDFNNFVTLLTDGRNDWVDTFVTLFEGGAEITDMIRPVEEHEIFRTFTQGFPTFSPDLVGARVAFVRLIAQSLDAGVSSCTSGRTGTFLDVRTRWQFWGTPRPTLSLHAGGCLQCQAGQIASFAVAVVNEGSAFTSEIRLTVTPPRGAPINLLPTPVEHEFAAGAFEFPLVSFEVPAEAPNGAYLVEAALVDSDRGVTLARASVKATKQ